ncbi:hypothetical protein EJB05_32132, partial [Eragrostis curvula]
MNSVLSAVLGDLTSRFISFITEKFKSYAATRDNEIPRLQRLLLRLSTIVMEAEARRVTNPAMLLQLRQLREAMYRGFYVMDTARTPGSRPNQWVTVSNYKLQSDMDNLETMLNGMSEFLLILMHCPPIIRQPYSAYMVMEKCMFGRQAEKEHIINFLLHPCSFLDVLPVIGPCYAGKRTLVEHACRDETVQRNFSRIFHFSSDDLNDLVVADKHKKLCLSDGRSLIVVEIVEDVDVMAWGKLNNLLSREVHSCSKVILISRMDQVSILGTVEAVRLARLHDEEFWYFFRVLAFGSANPYDHPGLASIANEIAKWINGSFMGAHTIISVLRANMDVRFWRRALGYIRKSMQMNILVYGEDPRDRHCSKGYLSYFHSWNHDGPLLFCYNRYTTKSLTLGDMSGMIKTEDAINARAMKYGEKFNMIFQSQIPPCYSYISYCIVERPGRVDLGNKCKSLGGSGKACTRGRDGNGVGSGRVEQSPTHEEKGFRCKMAPAPAPAGGNWHLRPSGLGWVSGARQVCGYTRGWEMKPASTPESSRVGCGRDP